MVDHAQPNVFIFIFKITSILKHPQSRIAMHFYVPGAIAGIIIFQVAIIAPTLSKKLAANEFAKVIRGLWPKFFIFVAALSATSLAIMAFTGDGGNYHLAISGFTFLASSICYLIIPATNRAKDENNMKKFDMLHKLSVWLTITILLSNIVFLFI